MRAAEQKTILPQEWSYEMPTLPAPDQDQTSFDKAQPGERSGKAEGVIGAYRIHSLFQQRRESTLYIASSEKHPRCILKVYHRQERREYAAAYQRLKSVPQDFITLLDWGVQDGKVYECLEKVDGQPLQALIPLAESDVRHVLLPKMVAVLLQLHQCGVLHNDIKPENFLWNEKQKKLWLIDYGNITTFEPKLQRGLGVTLAYTAPEILSSQGKAWSPVSDICALGLTLYTLLTGKPLVQADSLMKARIFWQGEVVLPAGLPMRDLLRSMLATDVKRRPSDAELARFVNLESLLPAEKKSRPEQGIQFKDGTLLTCVEDLLRAARQDWNFTSFMLQEHQLEHFLQPFVPQARQLCDWCTRKQAPDAGLFCLLHSIHLTRQIIWKGRTYPDETALVKEAMESDLPLSETPLAQFCCEHLLSFYYSRLAHLGYGQQEVDYAETIEEQMRRNPVEGMRLLQRALALEPELEYEGAMLQTLDDLAKLLLSAGSRLDQQVEELLTSEKFAAWLHYQGLGRIFETMKQYFQEEEA